MKRIAKMLFAASALTLALVEPRLLCAQQPGQNPPPKTPPARPGGSPSTSRPPDERSMDQRVLDLELLTLRKTMETEAEHDRKRRAAQLTEDLETIEKINFEKIAPLSSAAALDYKLLSDATSEIKNRASRIKYTLPFMLTPRKGEKIEYEADPNNLGSMLPELKRVIDAFLASPVFVTTSVNEAELRSIAGRDLERIVKLSGTINRIARQLGKTSAAK